MSGVVGIYVLRVRCVHVHMDEKYFHVYSM